MSESCETITKTVEIEVPAGIEQRAREQADTEEELEAHLVDRVRLEYEWVFASEKEE